MTPRLAGCWSVVLGLAAAATCNPTRDTTPLVPEIPASPPVSPESGDDPPGNSGAPSLTLEKPAMAPAQGTPVDAGTPVLPDAAERPIDAGVFRGDAAEPARPAR